MKNLLGVCAIVLFFAFNSFADLRYVTLKESVKESDLIIIGTLKNVVESSDAGMGEGNGEIVFDALIDGNVQTADGFLLEAGNKMPYKFTEIICNLGSHRKIENEKGVFLLTLNENGEIKGKDFRTLDQLPEIQRLLKKINKSKKAAKIIKIQKAAENLSSTSKSENSVQKKPEVNFCMYSVERKTNYRFMAALLVILGSVSLYYVLYRSRFRIR